MSIVNSATTVNGTTTLSLQSAGVTAATIDASQVFSTVNDAQIHGITVGLGGGSVAGNSVLGFNALLGGTGSRNVAISTNALRNNSSGASNISIGYNSSFTNGAGSNNVAIGDSAMYFNTSGGNNVAVGYQALDANTTASNNTAVGYQAGYSNTTGANATFVGKGAGYNSNGNSNTAFGNNALYSVTTGVGNTAIGDSAGYSANGSFNTFLGQGNIGSSGNAMTTGSYNLILGAYSGNQGGLDIRTASNYIVLSDGQGNPRQIIDNNGSVLINQVAAGIKNSASIFLGGSGGSGGFAAISHPTGFASGNDYLQFGYGGSIIGSITQSGTTAVVYNTTSDYRLKQNATTITNGLETISQLNPVTFDWISDGASDSGFLAHEFQAILPRSVTGEKDAVDEDGNPVYQQMDNSGAIPFLVAAIKELSAKNDALEARLAALEAK